MFHNLFTELQKASNTKQKFINFHNKKTKDIFKVSAIRNSPEPPFLWSLTQGENQKLSPQEQRPKKPISDTKPQFYIG